MVRVAWPSSTILICIVSTKKQLLNHCSLLPGQITAHLKSVISKTYKRNIVKSELSKIWFCPIAEILKEKLEQQKYK